tara:strand:+ start:762 stop:1322 length:561 start_codon:yes stop_codon:yes gene_type:complete
MSDEYYPWSKLSNVKPEQVNSLIAMLSAVRGDGKQLFGKAGKALSEELEMFGAWKAGRLTVKQQKRTAKIEKKTLSPTELQAKDLITELQKRYQSAYGSKPYRETKHEYKRELDRMTTLIETVKDTETVSAAFDRFIEYGQSSDRRHKHAFGNGGFMSFFHSFNSILPDITQPQHNNVVPLTFKQG